MERLWIANVAAEATDDDIKALVKKYAPELECTTLSRVDGDGSRPAVLMTFSGKKLDSLAKLRLRLDGMFWKGRKLACSTMVA